MPKKLTQLVNNGPYSCSQAAHTTEAPGAMHQECPLLPTTALQQMRQWRHKQWRQLKRAMEIAGSPPQKATFHVEMLRKKH